MRGKHFLQLSGKILEQVAQKLCGCLIPGNAQSQVGWRSKQSDLSENVLAYCGGVGLHDLKRSLLT